MKYSMTNLQKSRILLLQNHLKLFEDPQSVHINTIDVKTIIGADVYGSVILPGLMKGPTSTPIAQSTIFGWVISGLICHCKTHTQGNVLNFNHIAIVSYS
jgi:hypothetical protein